MNELVCRRAERVREYTTNATDLASLGVAGAYVGRKIYLRSVLRILLGGGGVVAINYGV